MTSQRWRGSPQMQRRTITRALVTVLMFAGIAGVESLDFVRVSDDGTHFVRGESGEQLIVWPVNYDHDRAGRLLESTQTPI